MTEGSKLGRDYTTGRAARELKVSANHLRVLCQAGLIAARATQGGHWRIPKSEVNRLKKTGVPEPPPITPIETVVEPAAAALPVSRRHPALLAEPSDAAIAAADEVVRLQNEVQALSLKREKEESLDWFRERQRRQNNVKTTRELQAMETKGRRVREEWGNTWIAYALDCVPDDAPRDIQLSLSECVRAVLAELTPSDDEDLVEQLVLAAVERGILPWRRSKETEAAIQQARQQLPFTAKGYGGLSEWELRATRAAAGVVSELSENATLEEIRAAAIQAGRQVATEFEHAERCRITAQGVFLPNTPEQQDDARQVVRAALDKLAVGATWPQIHAARDSVLVSFKATDELAGKRTKAGREADLYLTRVDSYLAKIASGPRSTPELRNFFDRYRLGQDLKAELRPIIVDEILNEPLDLDEGYALVESLVEGRLAGAAG